MPALMPAPSPLAPAPSERPLLSRAADSTYWMSRYVERAEHVARLLLVNTNLLIDIGDLTAASQKDLWTALLHTFHLKRPPKGPGTFGERCVRHMTFDPLNPNSLISCLTRARENARAIRESISAEMWQSLNELYWAVHADDAPARFEDHPEAFYDTVTNGSMLFQGLTDQTLDHDQRWLFTQVAKHFERVDIVCRTIDTRYEILQGEGLTYLDTPMRNIHWMAVLRMCCGIEAYRRQNLNDLDPLAVASFLLLEPNFPRSVRFCVERAAEATAGIRRQAATASARPFDPAERVLGRLATQLQYAETHDVAATGVGPYLRGILDGIEEAAKGVQWRYFLH